MLHLSHVIVSKSLKNDELHVSWDQPSGCIVFQNVEHSRVQALAFKLTEKLSIISESVGSHRRSFRWKRSRHVLFSEAYGSLCLTLHLLHILTIIILFFFSFSSRLLCTSFTVCFLRGLETRALKFLLIKTRLIFFFYRTNFSPIPRLPFQILQSSYRCTNF